MMSWRNHLAGILMSTWLSGAQGAEVRFAVVDEAGMARALGDKLIAGAAIDVTVKEPLERDSPLLKLENALITGHSAWYSDEAAFELFYNPMTQVVLALQGKWPLYAVNPQVRDGWLKRWGQK